MKNKLTLLTCLTLLLVSCGNSNDSQKESVDANGITWKRSVTLEGGNYGKSGITSGGDSKFGTWVINGSSITLTCPKGYAIPTVGGVPTAGHSKYEATSRDNASMNAMGPWLEVDAETGQRNDASGPWQYSSQDMPSIVNGEYDNGSFDTWVDCVSENDQLRYEAI